MAWKTLQFKLTSDAALLMHNGQTADPLNKFSKMLKQVSSKRVKTDSDYAEMSRIEFFAGLYMGSNGPILPAHLIEAVLTGAAKKTKEGMLAKSAMFSPEHAELIYDGPRTAEEMWLDERFYLKSIVAVGNGRVVRTRPIFNEWSAVIKVNIETSIVNEARCDEWVNTAGTLIGVGDWRPKFGRFTGMRTL